jgi:hypothetical protein
MGLQDVSRPYKPDEVRQIIQSEIRSHLLSSTQSTSKLSHFLISDFPS